jgi:hypothetical protein
VNDSRPSDKTRATEEEDARVPAGADEEPTPEEEAAAQRADKNDPSVAEHYEEMTERGAQQKGEGRLP